MPRSREVEYILDEMIHPNIEERLQKQGVPYKICRHIAFDVPIKSPADLAQVLGYKIERIAKSVLLRTQSSQEFVLAVCSVNRRLNLPVIATLANLSRLELATTAELQARTGYPPTSVSPIGVNLMTVLIDQGLLAHDSILIGGGVVGVELEMAPQDVITCSDGIIGILTK